MKNEYLILGSNNKWYATCQTKAIMKDDLKRLKAKIDDKTDTDYDSDEAPEKFYCYKAQEI